MVNKIVKIAVLGCGAVAYRWYLKGLTDNISDKYSVVAVCDIDEDKAKNTAHNFAISNFCTDYKDLLKYEPDLVVVLTRHHDHYEHIQYFLSKGINVYAEKPFAESVASGVELLNLAKSQNLVFGSAPQVMLSSRNIKTKSLIENNAIGKLTLIRASCSNLGPAGRPDTDYDPEWFYQQGGSLSSLGIYGLSTLVWFMGLPKTITCYEGIAMPNREVLYGPAAGKKITVTAPDNVVAMFDYGQGTYVLFDGSYSVPTPPKYDFEIHGTAGSLLVGGFGGKESIVLCKPGQDPEFVGPEDDFHLRWNLSWGVEDSVNAILENRQPQVSATFALSVLQVMEKMAISSKQRIMVDY